MPLTRTERSTRVAALLLAFHVLVTGSGCELLADPPGEGELAELGYTRHAPTIDALARYRASVGKYPRSLSELIAAGYLDQLPEPPQPDHLSDYRATGDDYELSFTYTGPGVTRCTYQPQTSRTCSAYH